MCFCLDESLFLFWVFFKTQMNNRGKFLNNHLEHWPASPQASAFVFIFRSISFFKTKDTTYNGWLLTKAFSKVTSSIKHKNTAEEIIIYTRSVYSLLLKLDKNEVSNSYFHFTLLLALARRLRFWFVFNSYLSERLHKYDDCDADMNIRSNSENLFTKRF